ncbi:hypothetical protein MTR67_018183, partial [Solanum verrucosum]
VATKVKLSFSKQICNNPIYRCPSLFLGIIFHYPKTGCYKTPFQLKNLRSQWFLRSNSFQVGLFLSLSKDLLAKEY